MKCPRCGAHPHHHIPPEAWEIIGGRMVDTNMEPEAPEVCLNCLWQPERPEEVAAIDESALPF